MPSAASNSKIATEKTADAANGGETPLNTIITTLRNKIRNLEKRKTRLDGYRELQKNGTKLTADQREAVKKYDEVIHGLELAKELCKQFSQIAKEANREAKRESKRNAFLKIQQESAKIREVLIIQDILRSLADDLVRADFLDGTNGAVKIEQADMDLLERLYVEVTPKRPARSDEATFVAAATHSANTLSSVIDARPKPFSESTYEHVREILQNIQNSGYFEKDIVQVEETAVEDEAVESVEDEAKTENATESEPSDPEVDTNTKEIEAPAAKVVPVPEQLIHQPIPVLPTAAPIAKDPMYPPLPPNTVQLRAVEYGLQKQYLQQHVRPIHEVIGQANFFFLQDSEIDNPEEFAAPPVATVPQPHPSPQKPIQQQQMIQPPPPAPVLQQPFSNQAAYPNMVPPMPYDSMKTGEAPPHIPPFAAQLPPMHAVPTVANQVPLAQPVQQIMQQQVAAVAASAQNNQMYPIPQVAGLAKLHMMIHQNQNMHHPPPTQQLAPVALTTDNTNALTEKLKSTLHINDTKPQPTHASTPDDQPESGTHDWNEVSDPNSDHGNSSNTNSWSTEMENNYRSGNNYKSRGGGGYRSDTKYRSDNKYQDKYSSNNTYRPRNNGSYQNGGGGGGNVFFQNNDRSYYNNNNGGGGNNNGGGGNERYKQPRNDLGMRQPRVGSGENNYRNQRGGGGPRNGDRDRIKA